MGMEAVKDAVVTYQGSASAAVTKKASQPGAEHSEKPVVAADGEKPVVVLNSGRTDRDGKENEKQQAPEQKNKQLQKAVEEINKKMLHNSEAVFGIHEETNRVTIKIVDRESKKVLKEIPPEDTLDMIAKVWELAGLMVDQKM